MSQWVWLCNERRSPVIISAPIDIDNLIDKQAYADIFRGMQGANSSHDTGYGEGLHGDAVYSCAPTVKLLQ
jgi:hypothetical protein